MATREEMVKTVIRYYTHRLEKGYIVWEFYQMFIKNLVVAPDPTLFGFYKISLAGLKDVKEEIRRDLQIKLKQAGG